MKYSLSSKIELCWETCLSSKTYAWIFSSRIARDLSVIASYFVRKTRSSNSTSKQAKLTQSTHSDNLSKGNHFSSDLMKNSKLSWFRRPKTLPWLTLTTETSRTRMQLGKMKQLKWRLKISTTLWISSQSHMMKSIVSSILLPTSFRRSSVSLSSKLIRLDLSRASS